MIKESKILHAVWLSKKHAENNNDIIDKARLLNIRDMQDVNPNYKTMFWVDNVESMKQEFENHKISTKNIEIKSIEELRFKESEVLPKQDVVKLNAKRYEMLQFFGNGKNVPENYAACSDILRLIALYNFGGFYYDVDTKLEHNEFGDKEREAGKDRISLEGHCKLTSEKGIEFLKNGGFLTGRLRSDLNGILYALPNAKSIVETFHNIGKSFDSKIGQYFLLARADVGEEKPHLTRLVVQMTGFGAYGRENKSYPHIHNIDMGLQLHASPKNDPYEC